MRIAAKLLFVCLLFSASAAGAMVGGQPAEIDCGAQTQLEPPAMPLLVVTD